MVQESVLTKCRFKNLYKIPFGELGELALLGQGSKIPAVLLEGT
jgi:hypothetical protein